MPTEISTGSSRRQGFQLESLFGEGAMMGGLQSTDECRPISIAVRVGLPRTDPSARTSTIGAVTAAVLES
jgi:hypothetical protein